MLSSEIRSWAENRISYTDIKGPGVNSSLLKLGEREQEELGVGERWGYRQAGLPGVVEACVENGRQASEERTRGWVLAGTQESWIKRRGRSVRILNFRCKLEISLWLGGLCVGGCQVDWEPEEGKARTRCYGDRRAGAWCCWGLILYNVCCVLCFISRKQSKFSANSKTRGVQDLTKCPFPPPFPSLSPTGVNNLQPQRWAVQ